jgi:hypothetical protein
LEHSVVATSCYSCWRSHIGRQQSIAILLLDRFGNEVLRGGLVNFTVDVQPSAQEIAGFEYHVVHASNASDTERFGAYIIEYTSNSYTPRVLTVWIDGQRFEQFTLETSEGT